MSRSFAVGGVVVAVLLVGGWVLAKQEKAAAPVVGPFAVTAAKEGTILLDTATGKAWVLHTMFNQETAWLAIGKRIDDADEAHSIRESDARLREVMDVQRRGTAPAEVEIVHRLCKPQKSPTPVPFFAYDLLQPGEEPEARFIHGSACKRGETLLFYLKPIPARRGYCGSVSLTICRYGWRLPRRWAVARQLATGLRSRGERLSFALRPWRMRSDRTSFAMRLFGSRSSCRVEPVRNRRAATRQSSFVNRGSSHSLVRLRSVTAATSVPVHVECAADRRRAAIPPRQTRLPHCCSPPEHVELRDAAADRTQSRSEGAQAVRSSTKRIVHR